MVSAQYYLKRFFSAMPKRFELIQELVKAKSRFDQKVLAEDTLSSNDIKRLLEIIGKDSLFRKAETKNRPTLRHMAWKLVKSIKVFDDFQRELETNKIPKEFKSKVLFLVEFLQERLPYIDSFVEKMDRNYKRESAALQAILEGRQNINAYKELLQAEKEIILQSEPYFALIRERTAAWANVVREYEGYLRNKGKNLPNELISQMGQLLLWTGMTMTGIVGVFTLFHPTEYVNTKWALIIGGIGVGGLLAWRFELKSELKEAMKTLI